MPRQFSLRHELRKLASRPLDNPKAHAVLDRSMLLASVAIGAWLIYFALATIADPYQLEYREGASTVMTQFLLEGRNPYALENQPVGTNQYGIVYSVVVLPLAALLGNGLLVHRVVSFLFIVLNGILVAWLIFVHRARATLAIACGLLAAMALATRGGLGAFPSAMGTFLFMAALIVAVRRSFDWPGLLGTTLLSLAAFYTKAYFLLALPLVILYTLLFVSKQRAVRHAVVSAAAWVASFLVIRRLFPLYFVNVLVTSYLDSGPSAGHLLLQLWQLLREFYPLLVLAAVVGLTAARSGLSPGTDPPVLHGDPQDSQQPLLRGKMDFFAFAFIGSTLAFLLILGPHTGQFMTYAYQLMLPPFLIWLGSHLRPEGRMLWLIAPVLILSVVVFARWRLDPTLLRRDESGDWARLYQLIDDSSHILNSPPLTAELIRQGKWPADSGQSEYYFILTRGYSALGTLLGPHFAEVRAQGRQYVADIRTSVRRGDYDLIALPLRYQIDMPAAMDDHYRQLAELHLDMPQTQEQVTVFVWTLAQ